MNDKILAKSELTYGQMRAMLQTLAGDDHALIKKLDIRRKQNGNYAVIVNVEQVENPNES